MRWFLSFLLLLAALVAGTVRSVLKARPQIRTTGRTPPAEASPSPGRWSPRTRQWLLHSAVVLGVLALLGAAVAASGIVPIRASSGHWDLTRWFLQFAKHRSVALHSIGTEVPPLDDPRLVLQGAGHYETGCRPCHGSPGFPHPRIAQQMTATPPYLGETLGRWDPGELFYIVKHGIKFTGMPAWPAQYRDDEVWAVVAFLQQLPDLDAASYQRLVYGEAAPDISAPAGESTLLQGLARTPPLAVQTACGRCHGARGEGRGQGAFPRLAGQRPRYLYNALNAYARGERHSGIMEPVAASLTQDDMRALARYYGSLPAATPAPPAAARLEAIARGQKIAGRGVPEDKIPSCQDCHGPGATRAKPAYPRLAGQYEKYLVLQLDLFKKRHRGGSAYAHLMHPVAAHLTPAQIRDVAAYYASLPPDDRE